jgi:hypothetical protein
VRPGGTLPIVDVLEKKTGREVSSREIRSGDLVARRDNGFPFCPMRRSNGFAANITLLHGSDGLLEIG